MSEVDSVSASGASTPVHSTIFLAPQLPDPLSGGCENVRGQVRCRMPVRPRPRLSHSLPGRGPRVRGFEGQTASWGIPGPRLVLRRLQALRRREIPDGDPAQSSTARSRCCSRRSRGPSWQRQPSRSQTRLSVSRRIRKSASRSCPPDTFRPPRPCRRPSALRNVPRRSRARSGDAMLAGALSCPPLEGGARKSTFLEFHHIQPCAKQGPGTVANISLRSWRHNQDEAETIFGPHDSLTAAPGGA
jgi:hypothetical protein